MSTTFLRGLFFTASTSATTVFSTQSSDRKNNIAYKAWFLFWNLAMLTEPLWMKFYNDEFDQLRNTYKA